MENRREFIKKASLLAGGMGLWANLPASIQAALKIDPAEGSSYLDAEHIVMVMQENRSFDHSFGALKGVRGFNDPRAVKLPNGLPVWLQSYKNGDTYSPARLDIKNTNAAWSRDLPHSWENQIGAWNKGRYDNWLEAKKSGNKQYRGLPLTLGYYNREDIPFYYAFADAFTVFDQHFCSSLTGTTTNRNFFWTGKTLHKLGDKPLVRNSDVYYNKEANWRTFPELLEKNGVSWRVYQNEISLQNELSGEAVGWLENFTNNNLEWFSQFKVRYKKSHIDYYTKRLQELPGEIEALKKHLEDHHDQKKQNTLEQKINQLASYKKEVEEYGPEAYKSLDDFSKALHQKAFQTNEGDPYYHEIEKVEHEGETITIPKGDVLHQFREDVNNDSLPTVSWLVAPQFFSDHPSAPYYGAWYISEVLGILTKNPEIWKKTIFILNYDENDGYFDHVPPFVAPNPKDESTGKTTPDLDCTTEYVTKEQEIASGVDPKYATAGPVGLGYRVPMVIASPWTKGGWVNSEICDITSTIRFIEHFVNKKFNLNIQEDNISSWRRAITGDLTSAFRTFSKEENKLPTLLDRNDQVLAINQAKEKPVPDTFIRLQESDIARAKKGDFGALIPQQEKGTKPSNALAYDILIQEQIANGAIDLQFINRDEHFKEKSLGAAFNVYAYGHQKEAPFWSFALSKGKELFYQWPLSEFSGNTYELAVIGPNGFLRTLKGGKESAHDFTIKQDYNLAKREFILDLTNCSKNRLRVQLFDAYSKKESKTISIAPGKKNTLTLDCNKYQGWYDITLKIEGDSVFLRQYAGRIENGKDSITDPLMAE